MLYQSQGLRAVDHPRLTWKDALKILLLGMGIGACYGIISGWWAGGYSGMLTLAMLERAAKTGIAMVIGFLVAGKAAGRAAFSSSLGAIGGTCLAAVNDFSTFGAIGAAVLSGICFGLSDRFGLLPGELSQPRETDDSENGNHGSEN